MVSVCVCVCQSDLHYHIENLTNTDRVQCFYYIEQLNSEFCARKFLPFDLSRLHVRGDTVMLHQTTFIIFKLKYCTAFNYAVLSDWSKS